MSNQEQTTPDQTIAPTIDEKLATHDLFATISADPSTSKFAQFLSAANLEPVLRGPDLLTVLALVNTVFEKLSNPRKVASDLILRGAWTAEELRISGSIKTLDGRPLEVKSTAEGIMIGNARLGRTNIECTNGVVHTVDSISSPAPG